MSIYKLYGLNSLKNSGFLSEDPAQDLRWGVRRRLSFIDFRLQWYGRINRSDLVERFQISIPQASGDVRLYKELAPDNLYYDLKHKCYYASEQFNPRFGIDAADGYLSQLLSVATGVRKLEDSFLAWRPPHDSVASPSRRIRPDVLRTLLTAIEGELSIQCLYQSMSRPDPSSRKLAPVALSSDGSRWHIRAYCYNHREFRDFVCSRMLEAELAEPSEIDPGDDEEWYKFVEVRIGPHPDLSKNQRRAVAFDYEMDEDEKVFSVRAAQLFYVLRNLGLDRNPSDFPAKWLQIVLLNRDELVSELGESALPQMSTTT